MGPTIRVWWESPEDSNQVIIDTWKELLAFLCSNEDSGLVYNVEIFERKCLECPAKDEC
jgi:hypothetical protein